MNSLPNNHSTIIRTERGLTIAGTRTTLYEVMDYLLAKWPKKLIQDRINLTEAQIDQAIAYIESNRQGFEKEYQEVVRSDEEIRAYWQMKNQARFEAIANNSKQLESDAIRKKIRARKEQLGL